MSITIRQYFSIYAVFLAVAIAPVWLTAQPPLVDYPNHLARMHLLINVSHSELLQRFYQVRWAVLPNLAMDLVIPSLATVMPLGAAGKVFITLTLFLLSIGPIALHYVWHGRRSAWPFVAFLFLHNRIFLYGFLNYLFGLGLALCTLAAWIHLRGRPWVQKWWVFSILATMVFFSHLVAFGVYALCVFGYEFTHYLEQRKQDLPENAFVNLVSSMAQFVIPGLLLLLSPTIHGDSSLGYGSVLLNPVIGLIVKLIALFFPVYNYSLFLDGLIFLLCVELAVLGISKRKLVFTKEAYWVLGMLGGAFLLLPFKAFSAAYADARLSIALIFLFIACTDLRMEIATAKSGKMLASFFVGVFIARVGILQSHWWEFEKSFDQYMQALNKVPEGSKLFTAMADPDGSNSMSPVYHLPCMAIIKKSAFVPSLFAFPTAQPIALTPPYQALAKKTPGPDFLYKMAPPWNTPLWHMLLRKYDYLLVVQGDKFKSAPPLSLKLVYAGQDFRLYKIPSSMNATSLHME